MATTFGSSTNLKVGDWVMVSQEVSFTLEQGSYLAGMAAGGMTKSGTLGMVGGVAIPPAQGTFRAFEAGAKAAYRVDVAGVRNHHGHRAQLVELGSHLLVASGSLEPYSGAPAAMDVRIFSR